MYYYYLQISNSLTLKRLIMILSASSEFKKKYNSEIVERFSDAYEMPQVRIFYKSYSVWLFNFFILPDV